MTATEGVRPWAGQDGRRYPPADPPGYPDAEGAQPYDAYPYPATEPGGRYTAPVYARPAGGGGYSAMAQGAAATSPPVAYATDHATVTAGTTGTYPVVAPEPAGTYPLSGTETTGAYPVVTPVTTQTYPVVTPEPYPTVTTGTYPTVTSGSHPTVTSGSYPTVTTGMSSTATTGTYPAATTGTYPTVTTMTSPTVTTGTYPTVTAQTTGTTGTAQTTGTYPTVTAQTTAAYPLVTPEPATARLAPAPTAPAQPYPVTPGEPVYRPEPYGTELAVPETPLPGKAVEVRQEPLTAESFGPARPVLVPEADPVKISVDNNRCHIYGICQQEAPEVFRISEGGSLHYTSAVPAEFAAQARQAVRCCPMQAIAIRGGRSQSGSLLGERRPVRRTRSGSAARDSHKRIVVAGGGLAGLSAATRLRERGFDGELVIIGEEPRRPYSRPPLSKQYLAGELAGDELEFRADDGVDAHWMLNTRLVALDVAKRAVELPGGEHLPFDGLIIATGVDAKRLPEAPVLSDRVRTIRTLEDAAAVQRAMHAARAHHVVILGGGFVGCELACTARDHGMDVTLVVHSAPLLRRVLGPKIGKVVGDIQRRAGVDVRLSTRISSWEDTGEGLRLRLDDGEIIDCDFVVLGLGSMPRTDWLRGSGLDVSDGVLCDPTCHTVDTAGRPVPGIVAAGDVARWPNPRFDTTPRRIEHLIHAVEMGQHAADALLRGPERAARFTPVPRFWSEQHGTRIQAVGIPALGEEVEVVEGSLRSERFVARYTRQTPHGPQTVAAVAFDMPLELLAYRDLVGQSRPRTRTASRRRRR